MSAADRAGFDAVGDSFTGLAFAQLAFGVLGVLAISAEYGTGMIRTTLTAVPRRPTVFAAKALVVAETAGVAASPAGGQRCSWCRRLNRRAGMTSWSAG
jgi:hypothetical protein